MNARRVSGLYIILDKGIIGTGEIASLLPAVLDAGVKWFQYRDKQSSDEEVARALSGIIPLCGEAGARLIVNDRARLVPVCGAHGVHLGQKDVPIRQARLILGKGGIVGRTVRSVGEAERAEAEGADYLGVGAIFPTTTKTDARVIGLKGLEEICRFVTLPVVAVGGINRFNAGDVLEAGASAVAVASAVISAPDAGGAARELMKEIEQQGKGKKRGKSLK